VAPNLGDTPARAAVIGRGCLQSRPMWRATLAGDLPMIEHVKMAKAYSGVQAPSTRRGTSGG
jgi:hypothetical protein